MLLFSVEILLYSIFVIYSFSLSPFLYFPRSLYGIWPWYLSIAYISIKLLLLNSEEAWLRTTLLTSQSFFVFFFFLWQLVFWCFLLNFPTFICTFLLLFISMNIYTKRIVILLTNLSYFVYLFTGWWAIKSFPYVFLCE